MFKHQIMITGLQRSWKIHHVSHQHGEESWVVGLLTSRGVYSIIALGIGNGGFYRLRKSGVKTYYVPVEMVAENLEPLGKAVEMFLNNLLEEALDQRKLD
ncbi:hypothetical protein Tagg_0899 [Thermosphaera aggregans DSM 11486]|uniref:Uncharacterized protein n=1 Tax=Thermosphaera aggregans (strain DSM 11486 / M11TL) TaxID=633148 RepID=D5U221_THEAM|nr:hypothetical protein Tagg_0899 [Thermosphaera aggregans DSM 11486]